VDLPEAVSAMLREYLSRGHDPDAPLDDHL
jgi:hypothetical protein